ncbi:hypothetical protein [Mesoterricola silvestris]|uniref:Uncharacterized protein n=1 Tax=Mesoterricola silvestris TaxID=2927979 RepID=A0AA48GV62_9BACT|nr:hypothetical protein [Mesoterricola silvestris]BDU72406.1 hypothetical protein METEAL_15800 [Mesoterricola silvestris]
MDLQTLANQRAALQARLSVQEDMQRDLATQTSATRTELQAVNDQINALLTAAPIPTAPVQ